MITDEERREVAARIKALPDDMYSRSLELLNNGILDLRAQDTADYYEIYYALFDALPAENQHPNDFRELHKRLADLIDRPACKMTHEGEGFRCSACGTYHDVSGFDEFPWEHCPSCGAVVLDGAED